MLNIWSPSTTDSAERPVMVWLHGGGLHAGSASSPLYDGEALALRGDVVVVTVNHRVGLLGFLHLAPTMGDDFRSAGMVGMLDVEEALRWVKDNISAFGGDPRNVTLFGQSGGGQKVTAALAMPVARQLFHRAVIQSGGALQLGGRMDPAELAAFALSRLGIREGDKERLAALPVERIIDVGVEVADRFGTMVISGVVDGTAMPEQPERALAGGAAANVPLLIGATADEFRFPSDPELPLPDDTLASMLGGVIGRKDVSASTAAQIATYRALLPEASNSRLFGEIFTGYVQAQMATIADLKSSAGTAPVWFYLFAEPPARHCDELRYLFRWGVHDRLADVVSDTWLTFARYGDPNREGFPLWPRYTVDGRATMILQKNPCVRPDPLADIRATWRGISDNF